MTIKEVCEKYNITADTLRYYEKVGAIPPVTRTKGGIRCYTDAAYCNERAVTVERGKRHCKRNEPQTKDMTGLS